MFSGFGALAFAGDQDQTRKLGSMAHGIGLLVILVTGISLLMAWGAGGGMPGWALGKIVIWVIMGGGIVAFKLAPGLRVPLFFALPLLGAIAAWLAILRPGS